jgi:hypothetical protein
VSIFRVKRSHTGTNIRGCKPVTVYFQKYEDKEEILRYLRIRRGNSLVVRLLFPCITQETIEKYDFFKRKKMFI